MVLFLLLSFFLWNFGGNEALVDEFDLSLIKRITLSSHFVRYYRQRRLLTIDSLNLVAFFVRDFYLYFRLFWGVVVL